MVDADAVAFVESALDNGLSSRDDRISLTELLTMQKQGYDVPEALFTDSFEDLPEGTSPAPLDDSNLCDPGTETRDGYECVPVLDENGDPIYDVLPLRILNARKGDALLSRACGLIGEVLEPMNQIYSHIGMMSEHHDMVVHSTFLQKRAEEFVGADGFEPHAIKYAFPGIVNQYVRSAYMSTATTADDILEYDNYYDITGFSYSAVTCGGDDIVEQKVLKPFPEDEDQNRPMLMAAADAAKAIKGHYRFFTYTHGFAIDDPDYLAPGITPDIDDTPNMNEWPGGAETVPSSCAVLVRKALETAGFFEPCPLPCDETYWDNNPLMIDDNEDGYFLYSADDRAECAETMYNSLYNMVLGKKGGFINLITGDVADEVGTQVANCFIWDQCGQDDSQNSDTHDDWRNPDPGYTVSPHNVFADWRPSSEGGPYGYTEPLYFSDTIVTTRYEWRETPRFGDLRVRVVDAIGQPLQDTELLVNQQYTGNTDVSGERLFESLPEGTVEVIASYTKGPGEPVSITIFGTVVPDTETPLTIIMPVVSENPSTHRITVAGLLTLYNDEPGSGFFDNKERTWTIFEVRDIIPEISFEGKDILIDQCYGDEVRVRIRFRIELLPDSSDAEGNYSDNWLHVTGGHRLFESWSCSHALDDPAHEYVPLEHTLFPNSPGNWATGTFASDNEDEPGSEDYVKFQYYIIHSYKWFFDTTKEVNLRYEWRYGHDDDLYAQGVQNDPYILSVNDRVETINWLSEEEQKELHTAAVLILHPDNQKVAVLRKTTLTGEDRSGPVGSTVWDSGWINPGSSRTGHGAIDNSYGWADLTTMLTNP